jgi:uncharacterized membrane protein
MKTTSKISELNERKVILSTLWICAVFNYAYADILTFYFNPVLQKVATQPCSNSSQDPPALFISRDEYFFLIFLLS